MRATLTVKLVALVVVATLASAVVGAVGVLRARSAADTVRSSAAVNRVNDATLGGQHFSAIMLAGVYDIAHAQEHGSKEPFKLPDSWLKNKDKITAATPFNFVSTADIIGGNSGSPVINKAGELVGIIFDGNIQSLVLDYAYSDTTARAVSVHSAAIQESLRKIYNATQLADELGR